jgi:hypothetical protein
MPLDSATQVQSRAQSVLSTSPIYDLRELTVDQVEDAIMISGRVSSYYHKQLAQETVRAVSEGFQVVNSVDVD